MTERASLEEVLEFANKVREAGGGNPPDGIPAKRKWIMSVGNRKLRDRIAIALNLVSGEYDDDLRFSVMYYVVLPDAIGQVAAGEV